MEEFHFSILRISVCQLLKASGFDKCKPLVVNAVTDLYIQYLGLMLARCQKFALARTNLGEVASEDVLQAMMELQLIKPSSFETVLDTQDQHPKLQASRRVQQNNYNTKSMELFVQWLQFSDQFSLAQKLSQVPKNFLLTLIEKRALSESNETDQDRKRRKLKEKQDFYNQFKVGGTDNKDDDEEEEELRREDQLLWLLYLAEKDLKLGNSIKYLGTALEDDLVNLQSNKKYHPVEKDNENRFFVHLEALDKQNHLVLGVDEQAAEADERIEVPEKLASVLPYNVKYPDTLTNDDLSQYEVVDADEEFVRDVELAEVTGQLDLPDAANLDLPAVPTPDTHELSEFGTPDIGGLEGGDAQV